MHKLIDREIEGRMVETVAHWLDLATDLMRAESSRKFIRSKLKQLIRSGTIDCVKVIEWASAGIVDADEALREVAAEMLDHGEPIPATIRAYVAGALLKDRGPHGKNAGRAEVACDLWLRDQVIAVMVAVAIEEWSPHLRATRNRASHRASASSVVAAALLLRGVVIGERRVEAVYKSLSGLLVQHQVFLSRPLLDPAS
jgi:hypothetical protein